MRGHEWKRYVAPAAFLLAATIAIVLIRSGLDAGKTVLNDVIAAMRPRLHLFGHHHEFSDSVRQGIRSIGLDVVTKSYLLVDTVTLKTERLDT